MVGSVGVEKSGIDVTGPTGFDQFMLMVAFGHSNFVTGAALIFLGLRDRLGALLLMAIGVFFTAAQRLKCASDAIAKFVWSEKFVFLSKQ